MKRLLIIAVILSVMVGCKSTTVRDTPGSLRELSDIEGLTKDKALAARKSTENRIRVNAVRDIAMSFGARSGLAWRVDQINHQLKGKVAQLDKVFNFRALMLDSQILPPVLTEGRETLNMQTPHSIRVADRSYRIVKQARFTTTPPVWRDYLMIRADNPALPDATLLPKNSEEESVWREFVRKGWEHGIRQANDIYHENLSRLKRDFQGMIRYRQLLAQNMVSAPQVSQRQLGVTGGGESMSINDRVLTIKALPSLKADTQQWQPAVTK